MRRTVISTVLGVGLAASSLAIAPTSPAFAASANDDFNNAQVILSRGESVSGSNLGATEQGLAGEPQHAGMPAFHSLWWSWTATDSGEAKIITCNSDFDTRLGVYTGDALNALTPVASALDTNGGECAGIWAGVTFAATAGTTYRIAVDTEGGLNGDGSGAPQGNIALTLTAPPSNEPPPPPDDDTNPGTAASEPAVPVTMPRFIPTCDQVGLQATVECPDDATGLRFSAASRKQKWPNRHNPTLDSWEKSIEAAGVDIELKLKPIPSGQTYGTLRKYLFDKGRGGEIIEQSVKPGTEALVTTDNPLVLRIKYYEPALDKKQVGAVLNDLEDAGEDRKEVKSKCDFINTDASPRRILEVMTAEMFMSGLMSQKRAAEILKAHGCILEVPATYKDDNNKEKRGYQYWAGLKSDAVVDVVGTVPSRNVIQVAVARPLAQDLAFVISEEPEFADVNMLGLGVDGKLTASRTQLNRITVQVMERATGRILPGCWERRDDPTCRGVTVDFYDDKGKAVTQKLNQWGEWTFTSLLERAETYGMKASYTGLNGVEMTGFLSVDVVDRKSSYTTMTGRTISWTGSRYAGNQTEIDMRKEASQGIPGSLYMPIVPGILGTGLAGPPTAPPAIRQIDAALPSGGGFVVGKHNAVYLPNDTNYLVGTDRQQILIGGGFPSQVAGATTTARRAFPNPFAPIGNWLGWIVSGIQHALESGEGTVAENTSSAERQKIASTAKVLKENGAPPPSDDVSDKGLGINGATGGNLIGQAGGNVISVGGLNLIGQAGGNLIGQAGGNLIGQAGGNLIGQAGGNRRVHGRAGTGFNIGAGNVISLEPSMMPVYGGNLIVLR